MASGSDGEITVHKLLIDKPSDFRFHTAYLAYSDAWDRASSVDVKKQLNDIVEALSKGEINYQTFYERIRQYRFGANPERRSRPAWTMIETQSKIDWRKREERNARNARHRR